MHDVSEGYGVHVSRVHFLHRDAGGETVGSRDGGRAAEVGPASGPEGHRAPALVFLTPRKLSRAPGEKNSRICASRSLWSSDRLGKYPISDHG